MFEKIVNSKIYHIIDLVVKILWLNILVLFTTILGLFFLSFGPALMAMTYTIKLINQKYEGSIWRVYYKAFKKFYKKTTLIFLIYSIILIVLTFNVYYFINMMEDRFSWFYYIAFIITFLVYIISISSSIHSMLLSTCYPNSKISDLFNSGFKLTFALTLRSLIFILILLGVIVITFIIPLLLLLVSMVSIGFSIDIILFKPYDSVKMFDNKSNQIAENLYL